MSIATDDLTVQFAWYLLLECLPNGGVRVGHLANCSWLLSILIFLNILLTLTATVVCDDSVVHVGNQEFIKCGW